MERRRFQLTIVAILVLILALQIYVVVDRFISPTETPSSTGQPPPSEKTTRGAAETDRIGQLERRITESEARIRDYADRSATWAIWTLRLMGTFGTLATILIAGGSLLGILAARRLREEAAAAARIRQDMEKHFTELTNRFVGFAKTIDIPKLIHSKETLTPMDEERFKEFDIQLLPAEVLGVKVEAEIFERLGWFWRTLGLGANERALLRFEKALELEPARIDSVFGKGICLGLLARKLQEKTKQGEMREEALRYIDRAIAEGPRQLRHRYLFAKGWVLDEMDRFPEALAAYEEARKIDPMDPKITYNIACTNARSTKYEEALAELEKITNEKAQMAGARQDPDFAALREHPTYGPRFLELTK